ncbi:MAG: hypothetical protein IVW57_15045 [Ktedonobacterales bacterium]|nr:hypothetical protein [Ktedonobacterales bacterium]
MPSHQQRRRSRHGPSQRNALLAGAALLAVVGACLIVSTLSGSALSGGGIHSTSGTVSDVVLGYSHARGMRLYDDSRLTLVGDSAIYLFVRDDFTPRLPDTFYSGGARGNTVTLWYTSGALFAGDPRIVALRVREGHGTRTMLYTTEAYRSPGAGRTTTLLGAAALLLGAAVLASAGWWRRGTRKRKATWGGTRRRSLSR